MIYRGSVILEKVTLNDEDLELFNRAITLLDDVEDVQNVYHNVEI